MQTSCYKINIFIINMLLCFYLFGFGQNRLQNGQFKVKITHAKAVRGGRIRRLLFLTKKILLKI